MDKPFSRQPKITRLYYYPAHPGPRAVFLVEARNRKEMRHIRELFDTIGNLAEVVPISHGAVMSYAVQVESDTSLFSKIEWVLKSQFAFSLVERSFTDVTFRLVQSLCEDADTQMVDLPECGVCGAADPFPTRITAERESGAPLHLAYCSRCSARYAEEAPEAFLRSILRRDRRRLRLPADADIVLMPEMVEDKPEWVVEPLAATG